MFVLEGVGQSCRDGSLDTDIGNIADLVARWIVDTGSDKVLGGNLVFDRVFGYPVNTRGTRPDKEDDARVVILLPGCASRLLDSDWDCGCAFPVSASEAAARFVM